MIKKLKIMFEVLLVFSIVSFFIVPFFAQNSIGIAYSIILPIIAILITLTIIFTIISNHNKIIANTNNKAYTKKEYIIAFIVLIISIIVIIMNFVEI